MNDKFNRKINYLRFSLTNNCNFNCKYCKPKGSKSFTKDVPTPKVKEIISTFTTLGVDKIRFTGGEPFLRKDFLEILKFTSNISSLKNISLTTNGIYLDKHLDKLVVNKVKSINISLDTLKANKFKEITGGNLEKVLANIKLATKIKGLKVKINCVLIKDFNLDEIHDFIELTRELDIQVRFIELMPIGESSSFGKEKYISTKYVLENFKDLEEIPKEYEGAPADLYKMPNYKGEIGLINPLSNKFCKDCNRVRVTSDGKLKTCLHSDKEVDLLEVDNMTEVIKKHLFLKEKEHEIDRNKIISKNMYEIGG